MVEDFTKLRIWQTSSDLVSQIYLLTNTFPVDEKFGLCSQMRRCSISIAANIAESCGRYYKKDKIRVLYISRGEIEEIRSHLLISYKLGYCTEEEIKTITSLYNNLKRQLNSYIHFLRS